MEGDENSWGLDDTVAPHFGLIFANITLEAKKFTGIRAISNRK